MGITTYLLKQSAKGTVAVGSEIGSTAVHAVNDTVSDSYKSLTDVVDNYRHQKLTEEFEKEHKIAQDRRTQLREKYQIPVRDTQDQAAAESRALCGVFSLWIYMITGIMI